MITKPLPPNFRGLIWVSSDDLPFGDSDDEDEDIDELDSEPESLSEEDDYTSESSDSLVDSPMDLDMDMSMPPPRSPTMMEEEDVDVEMEMQLDPTLNGPVVNGCPALSISGEQKEKRLSASMESPNSKSKMKKAEANKTNGIRHMHPVIMTAGQLASPPRRALSPGKHRPRQRTKAAVLTSSFKPWELLNTSAGENGGSRFVDLNVPGGISLRNFGIQVVSFRPMFSEICLFPPFLFYFENHFHFVPLYFFISFPFYVKTFSVITFWTCHRFRDLPATSVWNVNFDFQFLHIAIDFLLLALSATSDCERRLKVISL